MPTKAASISLRAVPSLLSSSSSSQQTSSTLITARLASINSLITKRDIPIPLPWFLVIIVFSLALIIFLLALYQRRLRHQCLEGQRSELDPEHHKVISYWDVRPGLLRRTTTGRLREEWHQWIAKPPPMRNGLRRRDSAVLFGPGAISRISSEPLLSAHEVEASGILGSDISDPPPAYTPRRY